MSLGSHQENANHRPAATCAAAAGTLALLVLLCWALGNGRIAALGPDYVPMHVLTASLMILLSCGLVLNLCWPSRTAARGFALLAVVGVEVMSVLVGAQFLFSLDVPLLRWFSPATTGAGGSSNPPMSPLSAATFMSAGLALFCELPPWGRRWWCRQTAATLALVPWSTSLVVLLMYVAGMPLLYGGRALPMSILTAFSLALLSFSVLLAAGCDTVPLSLFRTASRETPRSYPFTADSAAKG